jgi:hypothetical protein
VYLDGDTIRIRPRKKWDKIYDLMWLVFFTGDIKNLIKKSERWKDLGEIDKLVLNLSAIVNSFIEKGVIKKDNYKDLIRVWHRVSTIGVAKKEVKKIINY